MWPPPARAPVVEAPIVEAGPPAPGHGAEYSVGSGAGGSFSLWYHTPPYIGGVAASTRAYLQIGPGHMDTHTDLYMVRGWGCGGCGGCGAAGCAPRCAR